MKNKIRKILSVIIAFAMICSMLVIAPMTAMAETEKVWEEVWSQNFDNLTKNDDGTYNLYGVNTSALEIDPEIYGEDNYPNTRHAYLSTRKANDYALTLTHTSKSEVSFPVGVTFDETSMYKITYDWLTNAPNEAGKKSRVRLYQKTRDHYQVTKSEGKPYLTTYGWGTTSEVPAIGEWVKAEITLNSATKDVTVKWIKSDGTVILNKTGSQWNTFTDISFIELVGENGGQKIDNIVIAKEVETEVPDEPVGDGFEKVWSQNFDNLAKNGDGTYNLYGVNTSALEIDPEIYGKDSYPNTRHAYLSTRKANDYALTLTHTSKSEVSFPVGVTFDGTSIYKITYDWLTNAPNEAGKKSRVRFYQETHDHYQVTKSEGKPYLTTYGWGTTSEVPPIGEWVQAEITLNSATNNVTVKWIKSDGTVILNKTGSQWNTFTDISFIELVGENGGQMIDNILIERYVEETLPDTEEEVFETVFDEAAKYVEFEADVYYDGTSTADMIYAKSGSTKIELFKIGTGYMTLGDAKTITDTPVGWYHIEMLLSYVDNNAIITVTTPEGAVIQRADPRYLSSSSIDKLCIKLAENEYKNVLIDTEYKEDEVETEEEKTVSISSVTNRKGDYKLELTHTGWSEATLPINATIPATPGQGIYKLTYDWQTQCSKSTSEKSLVRLQSGSNYFNIGAAQRLPVFGSTTGATAYTKFEWYRVEVTLDFENKLADLVIYDLNGNVFFSKEDESISNLTSLTGINLHGVAGGQTIDNILIEKVDDSSDIVWEQDFNDISAIMINSYSLSGAAYQPDLKINPTVSNTDDTRHVYLSVIGNKVLGAAELSEGDGVILNLEFNNTTEAETDYEILAAYYSNGKLIAVDRVEDIENYIVLDMKNVDNLTFFIWEELSSIKPLSGKYEISDMKFAEDEVYNLVTTFYGDEGTTRAFSWSAVTEYTDMVIQYAEAGKNFDEAHLEKEAVETEYEGQLYYKVDISGLTAGKTYLYRIGDTVDDVWSDTYQFTTEADDVEEFTFIGLADPQNEVWVGGFANTYQLLNTALNENPETVFTLNLGDMINQNSGPSESEWMNYFKTVEGSGETLPHMAVVGNHETRGDENTAVKHFSLHFNNPKNGTDAFGELTVDDMVSTWGKGIVKNQAETVYSFDYGDVHFAVLNSGTDFSKADTITILTEQAKWLDKDLAATDKKWKIVMIHQGMYPAKIERYNTKEPLLEVIDKHQVDLVLQGHDHVVARTYPMRGDVIVTKESIDTVTKGTGTIYNILGSSGLKRYDMIANTPEWFAVLNATSANQPTYTVFKVDSDSIDVVTKQMNGLIVDEYSIVENK